MRLRNAEEADRIAEFLGLSPREFIAQYAQLPADRRSLVLTERYDGACIFLEARNRCRIYPARPEQCRRFPDQWSFPGFRKICRCVDTWEAEGAAGSGGEPSEDSTTLTLRETAAPFGDEASNPAHLHRRGRGEIMDRDGPDRG